MVCAAQISIAAIPASDQGGTLRQWRRPEASTDIFSLEIGGAVTIARL
jgi:hypothetical protein